MAIAPMILAQSAGSINIIEIVNSPGGIAVLAIFILIAGARGWWWYGGTVERALEEKDKQIEQAQADKQEWKEIALTTLPVTEKAVDLAERRHSVKRPEER